MFLLDDIRIRIRIRTLWLKYKVREDHKLTDPTDPIPEHWNILLQLFRIRIRPSRKVPDLTGSGSTKHCGSVLMRVPQSYFIKFDWRRKKKFVAQIQEQIERGFMRFRKTEINVVECWMSIVIFCIFCFTFSKLCIKTRKRRKHKVET